jgi:hypothetical protein
MIVYRIEHVKTREGPYTFSAKHTTSEKQRKALLELRVHARFSGGPSMHPSPYDDGFDLVQTRTDYFGFESPESLAAWFGPEFVEEAAEAGFVVSVYSVPESSVRMGGRQVVFDRDGACLLRRVRRFKDL